MKVLFVIPAYNEEANIENVIKEIKKDVKYADILIINDCSTDNTKKIIENNNVKCITGIFNLKYALTFPLSFINSQKQGLLLLTNTSIFL